MRAARLHRKSKGMEVLEQWLTQLVQDLEFPPLSPKDKEGRYQISLTPQLTIFVKELNPGIFFEAVIGALPKEKREELFIFLMKANLLGQGTGGAVLSLDAEEKFLTLSLSLPYDMNYKSFKENLEEFANFMDYWKEELLRHEKEAKESIYR